MSKDNSHVGRDAVKPTGTDDMDSIFHSFVMILKLHLFQELKADKVNKILMKQLKRNNVWLVS